jgi:hypothetical protein
LAERKATRHRSHTQRTGPGSSKAYLLDSPCARQAFHRKEFQPQNELTFNLPYPAQAARLSTEIAMRLRAHSRAVWLAAWLIGLALLVYVIKQAGLSALLTQVRRVGWSFGILVLLSGGRHVLRTAAWSACIAAKDLRPKFLRLFGIRLVGEVAADLTLAGPLLGEGLKVWLASSGLTTAYSLSSVVVENLMYGLAAGYFILGSIAVVLLTSLGTREIRIFAIAGSIVLVVFILLPYYILKQRQRLLTQVLEWSKQRHPNWRWRERHEETLKRFEESVLSFYHVHRRLFYYVFLGEMATNFTGVAEAYIILKVTSGHASFLTAYLLEALNRIVTVIFAFIPLRLGVDEGSAALMMNTLGRPGVDGVSLALVRKLRTLVWVSLGVYLMPQYAVTRMEEVARQAPVQGPTNGDEKVNR